ncbi:MAG: hypothetical protein HC869_02335 [Rhodospirillales bacterium]|nr:hypothetical protein [Rhodospirillales bacterium]
MKHSYLLLLIPTLLVVPGTTQAQVAGSSGATEVASRSSAHVSIDWAKERLDEMDATLASLEKKLENLKAENRAKAERALAEMREQREALKALLDEKRQVTEVECEKLKTRIETKWTVFEAAVDKWLDATGERVAERKNIFLARVDVQLKAWQAKIAQLEARGRISHQTISAILTPRSRPFVPMRRSRKPSWKR